MAKHTVQVLAPPAFSTDPACRGNQLTTAYCPVAEISFTVQFYQTQTHSLDYVERNSNVYVMSSFELLAVGFF